MLVEIINAEVYYYLESAAELLMQVDANSEITVDPKVAEERVEELKENFGFCYQQRMDETHSAVRFCTSWATKEENVDAFITLSYSLYTNSYTYYKYNGNVKTSD